MRKHNMLGPFYVVVFMMACGLSISPVLASTGNEDLPYVLDSFEVNIIPEGLPWKYAQWGDYEMITLCSRETSLRVMASNRRGQMLLPPVFQPARSALPTIILTDPSMIKGPLAGSLELDMRVKRGGASSRLGDPSLILHVTGGIRDYDGDSLVIGQRFATTLLVPKVGFGVAEAVLSECRPAMRTWLVEGIFGSAGLYMVASYSDTRDEMRFASLLWVDEETTKAIRRVPRELPELISLDRFFNEPPPDAQTETKHYALWQSQARLFVHWALLAEKKPAFEASAFWRFANDSRHGNVSEEQFRGYFGRDYATALAEMRAYLPAAVKNGVDRAVPGLHRAATKSEFVYRAATASEVARIKGNFERMEAQRLKESNPKLSQLYVDAARRSLTRATKFMPVDPRVYGVLGLLEFDTQQTADARRHLEVAYREGSLGSRGLLALARLRLDELKGIKSAPAKLTAAELEHVLDPVFAARERKPALVETYHLIAEVWACSEEQPTRGHLAALNEGIRLFPWDQELRSETGALYQKFGYGKDGATISSAR